MRASLTSPRTAVGQHRGVLVLDGRCPCGEVNWFIVQHSLSKGADWCEHSLRRGGENRFFCGVETGSRGRSVAVVGGGGREREKERKSVREQERKQR